MGRHLRDLNGVQGSKGVGITADSIEIRKKTVKLHRLIRCKLTPRSYLFSSASAQRRAEASDILGCPKSQRKGQIILAITNYHAIKVEFSMVSKNLQSQEMETKLAHFLVNSRKKKGQTERLATFQSTKNEKQL